MQLLLPGPVLPYIEQNLENTFTVLRLPEGGWIPFLEGSGGPIRAIATAGHHRAIGPGMMDLLPNLAVIANFGVGYDTVDAEAAAQRGIVVTNTPQVLDDEVADTAIGLLLSTLRELPAAERYLRAGKWVEKAFPLTRGSLRNRRVGLFGMGRIGQAIARRLEGFGVSIAYHTRSPRPELAYEYHPTLVGLAKAVDVLIAIVPGGAGTRNAINAEVLAALGPHGVLVNVARGSVVDEPALIAALQAGTIMAAGLDVFADEPRVPAELIAMDNVVLLPHVASASQHTRQAMGQLVIDNLQAFAENRPPLTPVPETPWKGLWKAG